MSAPLFRSVLCCCACALTLQAGEPETGEQTFYRDCAKPADSISPSRDNVSAIPPFAAKKIPAPLMNSSRGFCEG